MLLLLAGSVWAMPEQPIRLALWRGGEMIGGEEFLTADESIIDYLATLPRPTQGLKALKYDCTGKIRSIEPVVNVIGGQSMTGSVQVQMVYALHDCKPVSGR